jgi:hypothetical protein
MNGRPPTIWRKRCENEAKGPLKELLCVAVGSDEEMVIVYSCVEEWPTGSQGRCITNASCKYWMYTIALVWQRLGRGPCVQHKPSCVGCGIPRNTRCHDNNRRPGSPASVVLLQNISKTVARDCTCIRPIASHTYFFRALLSTIGCLISPNG